MATRTLGADGIERVSGGKDLKSSQAYPEGFGEAVQAVARQHAAQFKAEAKADRVRASRVHIDKDRILTKLVGKQAWPDAELKGIFKLLVE